MSEGDKLSIGEIKVTEQKQLTLEEIAKLAERAEEWRAGENNSDSTSVYNGYLQIKSVQKPSGVFETNLRIAVIRYHFQREHPYTFEVEVTAHFGLITPSFLNSSLGKYKGSEEKFQKIYETAERKHKDWMKEHEVSQADRERVLSEARKFLD